MTFLQPLAFFFFLLFIPVFLLYLLKQRRRRVQVSSLLFWEKILREEHRTTSLTRLRKLLSLLLQLLFISLVTFAIARPLFSENMTGARRIVILLDVSASMSVREAAGTRFELAREAALDVARGMSIGDSAMIVAVGSGPDVVLPFSDNRKEVTEALGSILPTHAATDFGSAFELLSDLPPDARQTYVYVVSDGAFETVEVPANDDLSLAFIGIGDERDNVGITQFQARALPASPRDFEILFEVFNGTDEDQVIPYEVRVNDTLIAASEVRLGSGEQTTQTLRQFSVEGGGIEVTVDYADAFPLDNTAYGILPAVNPIQIALVTEGNLFLETVLATDEEVQLELFTLSEFEAYPEPSRWSGENTVVIFDSAIPSVEMRPRNAVYVGAWPGDLIEVSDEQVQDPMITDWDKEHPINRHLHLTNITIQHAKKMNAPDEFDVLIRSFDDPLVVYGPTPSGKAVLMAFALTSSDFPLRVAFPILMANSVRFMTRGENADWTPTPLGSFVSHERLVERLGIGEQSDTLFVRVPGEDEAAAINDSEWLSVDEVGVYTTVLEGEERPVIVANLVNSAESRIAPSDELPIDSDTAVPVLEDGLRLGGQPWVMLTLLALTLICVEWFLFHRRLVE